MSAKPNVEVTQEVVKIKGFDLGSCFDSKEVADIWSDLHNGVINQEQLKYKLNGMLSVTN